MNQMIKPAAVRRSIVVPAAPARAFEVFTARFDAWWPRGHSIGASPLKTAVLEPREGGRWYGIGEDGSETAWGDVLSWDPPHGLVLAWRISGAWAYDPDLLTEVEVTFVPEGETTRVTLEHRHLERLGEAGEAARAAFESENGWAGILALYAAVV